ncbi:MAG TPA: GGDEF domain-containing protein, partial [Methylophilaceae bacterium]|nr:GGDEF domain-containing protein [Methylophilaceae bacterium]
LVLKKVTETIASRLRVQDIFGRYGGEEFNILLPGTSSEAALLIGDRLRQAVEDLSISVDDVTIRLTISIGLVIDSVQQHNLPAMLVEVDRALYQAKSQGRNRVVAA